MNEHVYAQIANYIRNHPKESFKSIAAKLDCSLSTVSRIAVENGLSRRPKLTAMSLLRLEASDGQ